MKDVKVLIGNYGSGKSELALNFAMQAAARGDRTELIDLDMVNTYFRLTERGKLVEQKEIRLISPNFACSGIETLSLPAEVASAFALDWDSVIFDVGGDDVGATATLPPSQRARWRYLTSSTSAARSRAPSKRCCTCRRGCRRTHACASPV